VSYHLATNLPHTSDLHRSISGLPNGFAERVAALLVGAYTQTGRPDASRLAGWLRFRHTTSPIDDTRYLPRLWHAADAAGVPMGTVPSPARVPALLSFEYDDASWYELDLVRMRRGLKLKSPNDLLAEAVGDASLILLGDHEVYDEGDLPVHLVEELAALAPQLRGPLAGALPYGFTTELADLLKHAADHSVGIRAV